MPKGYPASGIRKPRENKGGRPRSLPLNAVKRSYDASPAEHAAIRALLQQLRRKPTDEPSA